tara:strand:- start:129 stop:527 length:399 start_codon:yes stop_codon:yes gene_type:complete
MVVGWLSFGKNKKDQERRSTGGGQSGSKTFSDRAPTPKQIGGPLTGLGEAAISTGLDIFGKFYEGGRQISGDVQNISGKTQEAAGNLLGAITQAPADVVSGVTEGVTKPVGQLSKDVLPLAAIAAAVLLLRK